MENGDESHWRGRVQRLNWQMQKNAFNSCFGYSIMSTWWELSCNLGIFFGNIFTFVISENTFFHLFTFQVVIGRRGKPWVPWEQLWQVRMIKCENDTEIQVTIKQKCLEARMINFETYTKIQSCNETRKTWGQDDQVGYLYNDTKLQ